MKRMFFGVLVLLVLVSTGFVWAGGQQDAEGSDKITLAWSPATLDNPYFITVTNGFKDYCEENGYVALVADPAYDAAEQYAEFENWIAKGVDGISACPVDTKSLEEITTRAQEAGIIVVGQAQGIANADANIIVDDYGYGVVNGENASKWINEKLGGEAEVLILGLDHVEAVILRANGMEDKINELTNATIVSRQSAETMEGAMTVTETILQSHPNIRVISCVNDQLALGAWQAVQNIGIDDDDFFIGGADYTDEAIAAMNEEGSYFRVSTDIGPYQSGRDIAKVMADYAMNGSKGETFYFDMIGHWQDSLNW
jgi:ribose transport system substrate-binding protein